MLAAQAKGSSLRLKFKVQVKVLNTRLQLKTQAQNLSSRLQLKAKTQASYPRVILKLLVQGSCSRLNVKAQAQGSAKHSNSRHCTITVVEIWFGILLFFSTDYQFRSRIKISALLNFLQEPVAHLWLPKSTCRLFLFFICLIFLLLKTWAQTLAIRT